MTFPCDEETARSAVRYYAALILVVSFGSAAAGIMSWLEFAVVLAMGATIYATLCVVAQLERWWKGDSER